MTLTYEELQNELRAARDELDRVRATAAAKDSAQSGFFHYICHELREPLSAIMGLCEIMNDETFGRIENIKYREYIHDIYTAADDALHITHDTLEIVRQEAGAIKLNEELLEIGAFMQQMLRLLPAAARQLRWRPGAVALPRLYCDPRRLRQILLNVISNAVKFSKPGARIDISLEMSDGLAFIIEDAGVGINNAELSRVLKPFEQANTQYVAGSVGLGLHLAKAFMEAHGGSLELDSEPGIGTTVRLRFPPNRVFLGQLHGSGRTAPNSGRGRILVVEDEALPAKILRDVLEAHGYETLMAMSGRAALDLAREKQPDLIIMDIRLYDSMTGFEAVYWLKQQVGTAQIPIVGMTNWGIAEPWFLAVGCNAYVSKGTVGSPDFLKIIDDMVESAATSSVEMVSHEEKVDIETILRDLVDNVYPVIGINVSWCPGHQDLPKLYCDSRGLRKILWDTISYTAYEINHGGEIQIRTEISEGLDLVIEHNRWRDDAGGGFGSAKASVERFGGRLSKAGAPDVGTTMRISFPAERVCNGTVH